MSSLPLISVIIPVYNAKAYLDQCLQSVLAQTYTNLQIILVDDGSTDGSGEICDSYRQKDGRICVIHKSNGGVSSARNKGLEAIKGEYVAFVDSDDYIAENMYEKMYSAIEKTGADYAECSLTFLYPDGKKKELDSSAIDFSKPYYTNEEFLKLHAKNALASRFGFSWNKLISARNYKGLKYDEALCVLEDVDLFCKVQDRAEKFVMLNDCLYYYRQSSSSLMHKMDLNKRLTVIHVYLSLAEYFYVHNCKQGGDVVLPAVGALLLFLPEMCSFTDDESKKRLNGTIGEFKAFFRKHFAKIFFGTNFWLTWIYLLPHIFPSMVCRFDRKLNGGKFADKLMNVNVDSDVLQ